jgi:hypothetical protein
VLDLANLATSTLLGLLVAILAALLAVSRARTGTPALAGTPLVALAAARGNPGKGNTRRTGRTRNNSGGRGNGGNATGRGNNATGTGRSTTRNSGNSSGGKANGNGNGGKANQPAPAPRARAPKTASSAPTVNPVSGLARLVPGGLRDQVLAHLHQHPGEDFSPTQVANALGGRSSGAVGNALETLTKHGQVTKTSDAPRRFSIPQQGKPRNGRARKANDTTAAPTPAQSGKRQPGRTTRAAANGTGRTTSPASGKAPAKANGTGRNGNGTRKGRRSTR